MHSHQPDQQTTSLQYRERQNHAITALSNSDARNSYLKPRNRKSDCNENRKIGDVSLGHSGQVDPFQRLKYPPIGDVERQQLASGRNESPLKNEAPGFKQQFISVESKAKD